MVDDEKHKNLSKWSKKDYMRDYMRERRKKARQQPAPGPQDLHGPIAPKNLPRTESAKAILQAHYEHVLNLWAETGKELARVTETDEIVNTLDSLILENKTLQAENKTLQAENKTLREASKTCQVEPKVQEPPKPQEPPKTCNPQPSTEPPEPCNLQPSEPQEPPKREVEPGFVDPDRRPTSADDPEASWMG